MHKILLELLLKLKKPKEKVFSLEILEEKVPSLEIIKEKATPSEIIEEKTIPSEIIYLGLDLGTSQSAIVTSTGLKLNVASIVGWPKDFIAYNLVKKPIVFGDDCIRYRTSLNVYYPLEKGVFKYRGKSSDDKPINEEEAKATVELLKYLLGLVEKKGDQKLFAIVGAPARATRDDKQAIIDAAEGLVDSILVVSEPFLVAYSLGFLGNAIVVDLGAGTLDICRMPGTIPEEIDQRTLSVAGNEIDNKFIELLKKKHPGIHINSHLARKIKEEYAFIGSGPGKIELDFYINGKLTTINVVTELRKATSIVFPEIISHVRELIVTFDPEFMSSLARNIILAGGGSGIKGLASQIEARLSEDLGTVMVTIVEEPLFQGALGGLKLAQEIPLEEWEQL